MTDPLSWGYTQTFGDALVGFAERSTFIGGAQLERDETLTRLSPRTTHRIRRRTAA